MLLRLASAHSYVISPKFIGSIDFANYYYQSLTNSLDNILGKTISSVFFSFVKTKGRYEGNGPEWIRKLGKYLKEFFGEDAAEIIKNTS